MRHCEGHPAGPLGIVHPFPSVLVSLVVAALAALAGGTPQVIATLGLAMLGFQCSIGATNDLVDLPQDRMIGARKPLVVGQVSVAGARVVALAGALTGVLLSLDIGFEVMLVGMAGLVCGLAYDIWLRTRGLAWVAFAAASPLLLIYAWYGATGEMPPDWQLLLPMATAIGPALHLSNSMIDVVTDTTDPDGGLAGRMGHRRALATMAVLLGLVYGAAWVLVTGSDGAVMLGMACATALAVLGGFLSRGAARGTRALGWHCQATGTALLAISLVAAVRAG